MKVFVSGATGCVGRSVVRALRSRGHKVVEGGRSLADTPHSLRVDYAQPTDPAVWAQRLGDLRIDAVVNCVGILMPGPGQTFERVHSQGPIELFRGAAAAGVQRVVQVSALGVTSDPEALATPYLHSKLLADDALATLPMQWAVVRPSLIYGPHSQSAALFATLSSLPVVSLPGRGDQQVQPVHVYEVAEAVVRLLEQPEGLCAVHEMGGAHALSYREMLATYRQSQGLGPALWVPVPMPLMQLTAWVAEVLPQRVLCRDTIRLLGRGSVPRVNATPTLLGREPSTLAQGLATTPAAPMVDLRVQISPLVSLVMRASLALMWIYTAVISLFWPGASGVLNLLAQCGFEGTTGVAVMWMSCALNIVLGVLVLARPVPWVYALQMAAVVGYTAMAAYHMPLLTIDHCGPLIKNVPVLALLLLLWLARPGTESSARTPARRSDHASAAPL